MKNRTPITNFPPSRIILTDDVTAKLKADAEKYAGLREMVDLIIKRVRGEVGDILLTIDCRVEGMIMNWVEKVEERIKRLEETKCSK